MAPNKNVVLKLLLLRVVVVVLHRGAVFDGAANDERKLDLDSGGCGRGCEEKDLLEDDDDDGA